MCLSVAKPNVRGVLWEPLNIATAKGCGLKHDSATINLAHCRVLQQTKHAFLLIVITWPLSEAMQETY